MFELAITEQDNILLLKLVQKSKTHNVSLSSYTVTILVRHFGRARMIDKAISVFNEADPLVRNTHLCNTFLDFLLKAGRGVDGRKVLDEMLERGSTFPPNDLTGFMFFDGLARRGRFVLAVKWEEVIGLVTKFGEHGVFPDALVLHKLITRLGRSGDVEHAWDLVHVLMKMSAPLEASCFNALLTGLGLESHFEKMNLLASEMKEKGIKPDGITFGIRILYLCKSRRLGQAMEVLESMKKEKENGGASVVPDLIAYNTVIKGLCQVGRQEEGLVLVDIMRAEHGYAANTITYNCLLDGFCKAGEIDRSRELFDQMNREGVPADVITLNILVDGMCKHGRISSAFEFLNDMQKKGLKANAITYTSLISAFCNVNNLDKATAMFDLMVSSGCIPDKVVYYSLINGFSRAGRLDDACSVASKMKSKGFFLDAMSYNVLISGFCKKNKLSKVHEILNDMELSGVRPDQITYNTLIASFSKSGNFKTVHQLMTKMTEQGLVPTVVTFGAVIHGYCKAGKINKALEIFRRMGSTSKVPPNTVIYNILIDSLCKEKKIKDAVALMDDMKVKGVLPNVITYNAMFRGLQEEKWLDKAYKLMDEMNEQACNPDYVTMEILTEWLSAVGETARLKSFVKGYEVAFSNIDRKKPVPKT